MSEPFTLLGVPIDSVGRSGGTEAAPAALRQAGLIEALGGPDAGDLDVRIRGDDRDPVTGLVASEDVLTASVAIHDAVASLLVDGQRPFLAGGCCAELVGALAAARDVLGRVGLAYFDGHFDLYDGRTSPTGEAADMPISVALGFGPGAWRAAVGGRSVAPSDAVLLGPRDLDESLADGMRHPDSVDGLRYRTNGDVRATGAERVGTETANSLETQPGRFWLHLDVDVLDELVFPATDYLQPDGLTWDELIAAMRPLLASDSLIGASVACYNPEKDPGLVNGRALVQAFGSLQP
jgi:arginase